MIAKTILTSASLRESLRSFWDRALTIEPLERGYDGFLFTMPASYPDGWQIVLEITQPSPKRFRLTDRGRTMAWLEGRGQNTSTENMKAHIQQICVEHRMSLVDSELCRWLEWPIDAADVHVFTEGLVAVSQCHLLYDPRTIEENVAERVVKRIFHDIGLEPELHHRLNITKERTITVDFYLEAQRPVAVQLLKSKKDVPGTMERWAYRWDELRKHYRSLMPVMLYDRNTQMIDSYSRYIGETKCSLFCGYDETDRIHQVLEKAR